MMALYKEHGVNPASGCFPLLVQLPVLWAMFLVLRRGFAADALTALYAFVPNPGSVDPVTLGFFNLATEAVRSTPTGTLIVWPAVALALLTGVATYWQSKLTPTFSPHTAAEDTTPQERAAHRMSRQMLYIMPGIITWTTLFFPAGLALYWCVSSLVSVAQQWYILRRHA
jgi:YidC/Oxa1 family membrane protein insertase